MGMQDMRSHRSLVKAKNCLAKWRPVLKSSWFHRILRLNIVKSITWQVFLLEFERLDDDQGPKKQNCLELRKMVANGLGVKKAPWMEMDQWRFWDRTGHRWIEKSNMNVFIAIRKRMFR